MGGKKKMEEPTSELTSWVEESQERRDGMWDGQRGMVTHFLEAFSCSHSWFVWISN